MRQHERLHHMSTRIESLTNQLIELENKLRALNQRVRAIAIPTPDPRAVSRELLANSAERAGLLTGAIRGLAAATGCRVNGPLPQPADFGPEANAFSIGQARGRLSGLVAGLSIREGWVGA